MRARRLGQDGSPEGVRFAHPSEDKLAELLDFYGVRWEYEPVEFVLAWDDAGRPTAAFRPDFYLPDQDLFLELTTLRQELVTRKNRKLRRLAELYPDVRVRVLYRRDYARLVLRADLAGIAQRRELDPPALSRRSRRSA